METKQKNSRKAGTRTRRPPTTAPKKRTASRAAGKTAVKNREQAVNISPDVVYLAPKPFNRNRLVLQLATVAAVVVAFVLGLSVFFKVDADKIIVSGANKYTAWDVAQASGIEDGANLLTFSRARATGKIQDTLKYVKNVQIRIKLPDTVIIVIEEVAVTYAAKATDGQWWLLSAEGKVIESVTEEKATATTKILGIQLENPKAGQQAVAMQPPQTQTDAEGNLVPVTITAAQQLATALDIAGFLEKNRIIGEIASIDVNDLGAIQLWYGKQFQVDLGNNKDLLMKISRLKAALDQYLKVHDAGILDISDSSKVLYSSF